MSSRPAGLNRLSSDNKVSMCNYLVVLVNIFSLSNEDETGDITFQLLMCHVKPFSVTVIHIFSIKCPNVYFNLPSSCSLSRSVTLMLSVTGCDN